MAAVRRGMDRPQMLQALIAREAIEIACQACNVSMHDMMARKRRRAHVAYARQIAMYLAHVVGQLTLGQLSIAFERDRTTIGYACHLIEDRRDSPIFDQQIELMEAEMRSRMKAIFSRYQLRGAPTQIDVQFTRLQLSRGQGVSI